MILTGTPAPKPEDLTVPTPVEKQDEESKENQ